MRVATGSNVVEMLTERAYEVKERGDFESGEDFERGEVNETAKTQPRQARSG